MEDKLFAARTGLPHSIIVISRLEKFKMLNGWRIIWVWDAWKIEIIAARSRLPQDNDPENNVWFQFST